MVTFFRTLDVTALVRTSKRKHMKFNMLMGYCIGKAASEIKEFYILPAGDKLMQYDTLAINIIVKNKIGELSLCDILCDENMDLYNKHYVKYSPPIEAGASFNPPNLAKDFILQASVSEAMGFL